MSTNVLSNIKNFVKSVITRVKQSVQYKLNWFRYNRIWSTSKNVHPTFADLIYAQKLRSDLVKSDLKMIDTEFEFLLYVKVVTKWINNLLLKH